MTRTCLDTSAYSRLLGGDPEAVDAIDGSQWVGVPAIVLGELHAGFAAGSRARENVATLELFLANPVVEVIPVDHQVARVYGEIVLALRRKGRPIPTNDVWVAATAASVGATLLTADAHFDAVDRVGLRFLS